MTGARGRGAALHRTVCLSQPRMQALYGTVVCHADLILSMFFKVLPGWGVMRAGYDLRFFRR